MDATWIRISKTPIKTPAQTADLLTMCSSASSVSGGSDMVAQVVAQKQAAIQQQAALKAAALVMDVEKDSGARLIENLIKSANATAPAPAEGSIDVLA